MLQSPAGTLWNCTCAPVPCAGPLTSIPASGQDSFTNAFALTGRPVDSRTLTYRFAAGARQGALLAKDGSPGMLALSCAAPAGTNASNAISAARPKTNVRILNSEHIPGHSRAISGKTMTHNRTRGCYFSPIVYCLARFAYTKELRSKRSASLARIKRKTYYSFCHGAHTHQNSFRNRLLRLHL